MGSAHVTRKPLLAVTALVALAVSFTSTASAEVSQGSWSAPFHIGATAIHSVLLRTGQVLMAEQPGEDGSKARLYDSKTGDVSNVTIRRPRDFFCAGHTVLADGRVLVTGGSLYGTFGSPGVRETDIFDPVTKTWSPSGLMRSSRWYPTSVTLPSGKILVFSGQSRKRTIIHVEEYDPATKRFRTLPASADKRLDLYPRMMLLGNGKLLWAGQERVSWTFNPATASWARVGPMSSTRYEGTAVLLPGLNKVLAFGGYGDRGVTNTADIIDMSVNHPAWRPTAPMHFARESANAVLLLDGTVLVTGGRSEREASRRAEIFDPETETWSVMAAATAARQYHSTSVLLPDGRVLAAGEDFGPLRKTGEVFSPPYLFKGVRPRITAAPASARYGESLSIQYADASEITRVALVRPGSVTHSVNFDQRYVDLAYSVNGSEITATAPASGRQAPPGWYMLTVLNEKGVPASATWVQVG